MIMNDKMYEELKSAILNSGVDVIDDFIGYEHDAEEDKDVTENRVDMALDQMPEDIAYQFYEKYCIANIS